MKVMTVVGTRPEIIRLAAVMQRLDATEGIDHVLVHTGQNYDYELNQVFFDDLKVRKPAHFLNSAGGTFTAIVGEGKTPTMTVTCWDPFSATQVWQVPFPTNPDVEISNTVTTDGRTYYPEFRPKRILLTADRKMVLVLTHTNLIFLEKA